MPVFIQCVNCGRKLRVRTDLVGRSVRCPGCQAKFTARPLEEQGTPAAAPEGPPSALAHAADAEESAAPTMRRPAEVPEAPSDPLTGLKEAVTARPSPADRAGPAEGTAEKEGAAFETPARKVFLVLGLILLLTAVLGLVAACWISSALKSAPTRRADIAAVRILAG